MSGSEFYMIIAHIYLAGYFIAIKWANGLRIIAVVWFVIAAFCLFTKVG